MAASTPSTCLRSESDCVHSQNSSQASSRETSTARKLPHRHEQTRKWPSLPFPRRSPPPIGRLSPWQSSSSKAATPRLEQPFLRAARKQPPPPPPAPPR